MSKEYNRYSSLWIALQYWSTDLFTHSPKIFVRMFLLSSPLLNFNFVYQAVGNAGFIGAAYNAPGGYIPSFHKKEVGSAGQRIQLAPLGPSVTGTKWSYLHCAEINEVI